jgi:hypothetical protein
MAELPRLAQVAVKDHFVQDQPHPDAGAQGDDRQVAVHAPRSKEELTEGGYIGVVLHVHWKTQGGLQLLPHRPSFHREIGSLDDHSGGVINATRDSQPDPDQPLPGHP